MTHRILLLFGFCGVAVLTAGCGKYEDVLTDSDRQDDFIFRGIAGVRIPSEDYKKQANLKWRCSDCGEYKICGPTKMECK